MYVKAALLGIICIVLNFFVIKFSVKKKIFQPQREDRRKHKKIPTFGGIIFLLGFLSLINKERNMVIMAIIIGLLGLYDDILKVIGKNELGLEAWKKIIIELLISYVYMMSINFERSWLGGSIMLYNLWGALVLISTVNAVNITDGIDALASINCIGCLVFLYYKTYDPISWYVIMMILAFLCFNVPPAKLYMGDVGALSLGTIIGGLFLKHNLEWALLLVGVVMVIQTFSSLIQMITMHCLKKRIFLMSPLHHHLFLKGWRKKEILFLFYSLNFFGFILAMYLY